MERDDVAGNEAAEGGENGLRERAPLFGLSELPDDFEHLTVVGCRERWHRTRRIRRTSYGRSRPFRQIIPSMRLAIAALLFASVLTACGGSNDSGTSEATTPASATTAATSSTAVAPAELQATWRLVGDPIPTRLYLRETSYIVSLGACRTMAPIRSTGTRSSSPRRAATRIAKAGAATAGRSRATLSISTCSGRTSAAGGAPFSKMQRTSAQDDGRPARALRLRTRASPTRRVSPSASKRSSRS